MIDLLRRHALELGELFVSQGRLRTPDQVFDLRLEEVTRAETDPELELLPLVEKNLAPRRIFENAREWPRFIDSRGKVFRHQQKTDDGFVGEPISQGIVRGQAKILREPYEKPLKKGEILITRGTDPGWTPLFMNAAGIVLEFGGPL